MNTRMNTRNLKLALRKVEPSPKTKEKIKTKKGGEFVAFETIKAASKKVLCIYQYAKKDETETLERVFFVVKDYGKYAFFCLLKPENKWAKQEIRDNKFGYYDPSVVLNSQLAVKFFSLESDDNVYSNVCRIQEKEKEKAAFSAAREREKKVEKAMACIEKKPLPKALLSWTEKEHFDMFPYGTQSAVIVRLNEKAGECYCTKCGATFHNSNARHAKKGNENFQLKEEDENGQEQFCPKCKSRIIFKSLAYVYDDKEMITVLQKINIPTFGETLVLRHLLLHRKFEKKEIKSKITVEEYTRTIFNGKNWKSFTKSWNYFTKKSYWRAGVNPVYSNSYRRYEGYLYPKNLKAALKGTPFEYFQLEKAPFFRNWKYVLERLVKEPEREYLLKAGLTTIATAEYSLKEILNSHKKTIWECLKISKEGYKILRSLNGGLNTVELIQYFEKFKVLQEMKNEIIMKRKEMLSMYLSYNFETLMPNIEKLGIKFKEIKKYVEKSKIRYSDYADFTKDLLLLRYDRSKAFPRDFVETHHKYAEEVAKNRKKYLNEGFEKACVPFMALASSIKSKVSFEYKFPSCWRDLTEEGNRQHNCVGGSNYVEKMIKSQSFIVFVDYNDKHITVEADFSTGYLLQCLGVNNKKVTTEEEEKEIENFTSSVAATVAQQVA